MTLPFTILVHNQLLFDSSGSILLTSSVSLIDNSVGKFLPLTSDGGCPVYILAHTTAGLVGGGQKAWLLRWCLESSQPHRAEGLAS